MVAKVFQYSFIQDVVAEKDFKATKTQSEFAERALQTMYDNIRITGVALSGIDENRGIIITATFTADTNQVMAINTHRIKFVGKSHYGFEEDIEKVVESLEKEVFEFIYEGKAAQLEIFGGDDGQATDGKMKAANDN